MILKIAMIILLIVIIVLVIKYLYVQANILSSKEFRRTAERKSVKMQIKSPEITCDYCGCIINTATEKRCPNCGAAYGHDKELKNRYSVDEAAVEKMADDAANDAIFRAHKKGRETLHHIRIAIIALVSVFVLMVVYSIFFDGSIFFSSRVYRGNEKLKDNNYSDYTLIDSPEVTILDQDGVTLRLMSIYANTENGKYDKSTYKYRVGFSLTNKRKKPICLSLKCVGINGRCDSLDYIYIYSYFKRDADVLFYENVYGEWFDSIDEIVIGECLLRDDNGDIYKKSTMEAFELNDEGYTVITEDKDMGSVIFENDKVRIRSLEKVENNRGYDLWIENNSGNDYYVNTTDIRIDDEVSDSYILFDAGLPAGYTLHHNSVYGMGDDFENRADDAVVEVSFSFSDPEDPKNDFSTGYVNLK